MNRERTLEVLKKIEKAYIEAGKKKDAEAVRKHIQLVEKRGGK